MIKRMIIPDYAIDSLSFGTLGSTSSAERFENLFICFVSLVTWIWISANDQTLRRILDCIFFLTDPVTYSKQW